MLFCQQEFKIALFKQTDCHLDLKVQKVNTLFQRVDFILFFSSL